MTTKTTENHKVKDLYKGVFDNRGETFVQYVYAGSEKQAKLLMIRQIAKGMSKDPAPLFFLFDGSRDNFCVRKEMSFEEDNDEM